MPSIGRAEIDAVSECVASGWLTSGARMRQFESEFAGTIGAKNAVAVNSATAGLHLALEALGIGPGDKVVTTPYTFTASAEVIRYLGADPLFVDIDRKSFCIDPEGVRAALGKDPAVKAILPVHYGGQACEMDAIMDAARANGVSVVEDAAHALPTTYKGTKVGNIGDLTVFSFYVTKTLATGEGGMVTTERDDLADRMRCMRLHGISRDVFDRYQSNKPSWYYEVVAPGFKYNMPDIAAALGLVQLARINEFQSRRAEIAKRYDESFSELPVDLPKLGRLDDQHAWHLYPLQLRLEDLDVGRDRIIELLADAGIGTSVHFIPLHIQPYWRDQYGFAPDDFPVSYDVYRRAVSLPIYPAMSDADVSRVIREVCRILSENRR